MPLEYMPLIQLQPIHARCCPSTWASHAAEHSALAAAAALSSHHSLPVRGKMPEDHIVVAITDRLPPRRLHERSLWQSTPELRAPSAPILLLPIARCPMA